MKLFILTAALSFGLNVMAATNPVVNPTISPKALKTFNDVFSDAKDVQWSTTANYNEAHFRSGAVTARVMIDNSGKLVRTIRYYPAAKLPSNILYKVKEKYSDKEVFGVTEITNESGTAYHIVVRDDQYIYNIDADNSGNISQAKKFRRGDK